MNFINRQKPTEGRLLFTLKKKRQRWITVHLKPFPTAGGLLHTLRDTLKQLKN